MAAMPRKRHPDLTFEFKDNSLHISRGGRLGYEICVWPKPQARTINALGDWQRFYPDFRVIDYPYKPPKKKVSAQLELGMDLPPPIVHLTKEMAYEQLRQSMPFAYAIALAPFQSHQWNLIVLLSMKRRFYDLMKSNAVLAYLLANNRDVMMRIYRKELMMDTLTGMKQPELFKLLGFPDSRQFAQIVRKIKPASASPAMRELLRHCIQDEQTVKKLSHLKKINTGVLTLLTRSEEIRRLVTPQLLEEVSERLAENRYPAAAHQLAESLQHHRQLRDRQPFPAIRTLEALSEYHERLVLEGERAIVKQEQRELDHPFGDPPVSANDTIIPLRTPRELLREGQEQHNCVGSYSARVRDGNCFIYKVIAPERATLSITRSRGSQWDISELLASCNRKVSPQTTAAVHDWLSQTAIGI